MPFARTPRHDSASGLGVLVLGMFLSLLVSLTASNSAQAAPRIAGRTETPGRPLAAAAALEEQGADPATAASRPVELAGDPPAASAQDDLDGDPAAARPVSERQLITTTLYSPEIRGAAPAGMLVTLTLIKFGQGRVPLFLTGNADGELLGRFLDDAGRPVPVEPGSEIIVAFGDQLADRFSVPRLSAWADADGDRIRGRAVPGAVVAIRLADLPGAPQLTQADALGDYSLDLAGQMDVRPGSAGVVAAAVPTQGGASHDVALAFAAPQVAVTLESARLSGVGPSGQSVSVTLSRCGMPAGSASGWVATEDDPLSAASGDYVPIPSWQIEVGDEAEGEAVPLQPEDALTVRFGSEVLALRVPDVTVWANAELDAAAGKGPPNQTIQLRLERGADSVVVTRTANAAGEFAAELSGVWDVQAQDSLRVTATFDGGHSITRRATVDPMTIRPETGVLEGYALPGVAVSVEVTRPPGGQILANGRTTATQLGAFAVVLADPTGVPARLAPGDLFTVHYGTTTRLVSLPPLGAVADTDLNRLAGGATPGFPIRVQLSQEMCDAFGERHFLLTPESDGSYRLDGALRSGLPELRAGTRLGVSQRLTDGLVVSVERQLPIVHVQAGGNLVTGNAAPYAAIALGLWTQGSPIGFGQVVAGPDGAFGASVADAVGQPVVIRADDHLALSWTQGIGVSAPPTGSIQLDVPRIEAAVDPASRAVFGVAPSGWPVYVQPRGIEGLTGLTLRTRTTPQGFFSLTLPAGGGETLAAESMVEAGLLDPVGHHFFTRAVVPYLEVVVGQADIAGRASPMATLHLTLLEDTAVLAETQSASDTYGRFGGVLRGAGGASHRVQSGDTVRLQEPGGRTTSVLVPQVSVAIDTSGRRIAGIAPANRPLDVRVTVRGRDAVAFEASADALGRWAVTEDALRARGVQLSAVARVDARLRVGNGHLVIARTSLTLPTPTPRPSPPAATAVPATSIAPRTPSPEGSATPTPTEGSDGFTLRLYFPLVRQFSRGAGGTPIGR